MNKKPYLNFNKKILIVSSWAPPQVGGAQSLYNIFSNISPKDYFILTSEQNFRKENNPFGTKLECDYFFYDKENNLSLANQKIPSKNKYYYVLKKIPFAFEIAKNIFSFLHFSLAKRKFVKKIITCGKKISEKEKMDVIIGLSNVELNLLSTYFLAKKLKKPLVLYLFDLYLGNQLSFPYNIIARIFEPIIFKRAEHIIVTNETTKDFYVKKYGNQNKYSVIYNSVFSEEYSKYVPIEKKDNEKKIKILFTGNIYWAQESSVENLLKLAIRQDNNIYVDIYCPNPPLDIIKRYKNNHKIKFTSAPQKDMPKVQSEADILFLPLAWHTKTPYIIKTASPGKLTDYLISGKPILAHVPEYSFVAKYAKENNFAEVVDTEDQDMLKNAILKIFNDKEYAQTLVANAQKTFYNNHDAYKNTEKLTKIINNM